MDTYAVIVAGGSGNRMQSELPKQFLELCGRPILMHSIMAFANYHKDMPIVVVLPAAQIPFWQELCELFGFVTPHQIAEGGTTRFHSVKNGLSQLPDTGLVAIHDGVRPLVNQQTIAACFHEARGNGNAIPVTPVIDSVREIMEDGSRTIDRSNLRLVQTPQVFDITMLKAAYKQEYTPTFTDDASVFEKAGHNIHLVEGNVENIKITTRYDLVLAQSLMGR